MTSDVLNFFVEFFRLGWNLLRSFYIPGTNITPLAWILFSSFVVILVRFIKSVFGSNDD